MTNSFYYNNISEVENSYRFINVNRLEKQIEVNHQNRKYYFYGKSVLPHTLCQKITQIFKLICQTLLVPLTFGLIFLSDAYVKLLSKNIDRLKEGVDYPSYIYVIKNLQENQPNSLETTKTPAELSATLISNPRISKAVVSPSELDENLTTKKLQEASLSLTSSPNSNIQNSPFNLAENSQFVEKLQDTKSNPVLTLVPLNPPILTPHLSDVSVNQQQNNSFDERCQKLLAEMKKPQHGQNLEMVTLFNELETNDTRVSESANRIFEFLINNGISLYSLYDASLPTSPLDPSAIKKIAVEQSHSNNPIICGRASVAYAYLINRELNEGFEAAAELATKKLRNPNKEIQQEGFDYFVKLLEQQKPNLIQEDLLIACDIASKMFVSDRRNTNDWLQANSFFEKLIKYGKEDDILKIKPFIINLCTSDHYHMAYKLCDLIVTTHPKCESLLSIPLEAVSESMLSENSHKNNEIFSLHWRLLFWAPELTWATTIKCIMLESRKRQPDVQILTRLKELTGKDLSNQTFACKKMVRERYKEYSKSIIEALNNLSNCESSYIRQEAVDLKVWFENKLNS